MATAMLVQAISIVATFAFCTFTVRKLNKMSKEVCLRRGRVEMREGGKEGSSNLSGSIVAEPGR